MTTERIDETETTATEESGTSLEDAALFVILQEAIREAMESNREDEQ